MNCTLETGKHMPPRNEISCTGDSRLQGRNPFLSGRSFVLFTICALFLTFASTSAYSQGVLTITPGQTISTTAGTGSYDNGASGISATSAALANPASVAYDSAGNLYIADTNNQVIRKIDSTGIATIVAGSGNQGFSGDGGAATSAALNNPLGIAVDAGGNLYIADTQNQRVRKVSNGVITTIAGTGTFGYSGDGGPATQATLASPSGVAVDSSGNVYIADTNNHLIRKVASNGTITTFAGNTEQGNNGSSGAATSISLDSPSSVAVDAAGRVYIADRRNQVVRMVDTNGRISTIAGNGSFGYGGDANSATSASLAMPTGVGVDSAGNVYIADSRNNRIREVSNGVITTIAGTDVQGFGGDSGAPAGAALNSPRAVAAGPSGNLAVADQLNQRVRTISMNTLSFGSQPVGSIGGIQNITLSNSGNASLQVQTANFSGAFGIVGGSCGGFPVILAASASCTESIAFIPLTVGVASGSVVFSGPGLVPQSLLLTGTAVPAGTTTSLITSSASAYQNVAIALNVKVASITAGVPAGTVGIYDSDTLLGTVTLDATGSATYSTSSLSVGTHSLTARYSGNGNYLSSVSSAISETILQSPGFTIDPVSGGGGGSGSSGSSGGGPVQSVLPGEPVTYGFTIQAQNAPLTTPVVFSALGLPTGATAIFNPPSLIPGLTASTFTMTIQTPKPTKTAALSNSILQRGVLPIASALLLLPFIGFRKVRQAAKKLPRTTMLAVLILLAGVAATGLTGCGAKSTGFFGQAQQSYTITVVGSTITSSGTTLQRVATVTLTIQ